VIEASQSSGLEEGFEKGVGIKVIREKKGERGEENALSSQINRFHKGIIGRRPRVENFQGDTWI